MPATTVSRLDAFDRLPPDALRFLRALRRHNTREWFTAQRDRYEQAVLLPMRALVEEMDVRLAGFAPEIVGNPKRSLFRIHRDVRFSTDKSPYKTNAACLFYHRDRDALGASDRTLGGAGFYFHVEPGASFVGGGIYHPPAPVLARLRAAIADDPDALAAVLDEGAFRARYGTLDESEMLTRPPRGYTADSPGGALLRHRSLTAWHPLDDAQVTAPELPDVLEASMRALLPLVRWVNDVLGLPRAERR